MSPSTISGITVYAEQQQQGNYVCVLYILCVLALTATFNFNTIYYSLLIKLFTLWYIQAIHRQFNLLL